MTPLVRETIARVRHEAVLRAMAAFWHNDPDSPTFAEGARKMYEAATDAVIAANDAALSAAGGRGVMRSFARGFVGTSSGLCLSLAVWLSGFLVGVGVGIWWSRP